MESMNLSVIRKILTIFSIFFLAIFTFTPNVFASDVFKLTSANFDTSGAFVILTAGDNSEKPILQQVKTVTLDNPRRLYFDIDSAILTFPKREWSFKSGNIKEFKISQFSNDPPITRVVIYPADNYDVKNINIVRFKNNIIIKFKNLQLQNNYFQNTYRDEHTSASDFYEYATVMSNESVENIGMAGQIQNAFNQATESIIKKDLKLNSKYYLNSVSVKGGGLLINGFGSTTIERPLILTNPSRIVFDIPNAVVNPSLRNKEFQINQTDKARIGQFSVNKARVTITSENVHDYVPVFSNDGQAIILANHSKIDSTAFCDEVSDAISYNVDKENSLTDSLILSFTKPVVHGIDRNANNFDIYLYNVMKYNEAEFKNTITNSIFSSAKISLMPKIGLKMSLPVNSGLTLSSYTSVDGKNIKISLKRSIQPQATKTQPNQKQQHYFPPVNETVNKPDVLTPYQKYGKTVVLDAGHGGKDVGAIGGGKYYEKDITLDITQKVKSILEKNGYTVIMTRSDDTYLSLQERVDISENSNADIFVSIHVNSSTNPAVTGLETHYYHQESIDLAQSVHSSLASSIDSPNRGLFKSKFYVINHTTRPAILVETGFISNSSECSDLNTQKRRQLTAQAIADGIKNYLK